MRQVEVALAAHEVIGGGGPGGAAVAAGREPAWPGGDGREPVWPGGDGRENAARGRRPAGVLVALFEEEGQARVILTRRSAHLHAHAGEVSFPGGGVEIGESAQEAALREAHEEVGIDPDSVRVIAELPGLATLSAASGITPFVGLLDGRPHLVPNPNEVALAFDVALVDLMAPGVFSEEIWVMADDVERAIQFYELPEDMIWGATAKMLTSLLVIIMAS
ncbi:MAG: NUDIX hydrolase [Acidimicrobiales bacterium]